MFAPFGKRSVAFLALGLFALTCYGCGVIFGGASQTLHLSSSPDAARVTGNPPIGELRTPTAISLERKNSYVLTFEKEGYEPAQYQVRRSIRAGIVVLDVLFTGLVGVVVDASTGAWYRLSPQEIVVSLTKKTGSVDGPDTVEVSLRLDKSHAADVLNITAAAPGVSVKVERMD